MAQTVGRSPVTVGYRIRQGNYVGFVGMPYVSSLTPFGRVRIVYDDGTEDDRYFDPSASTVAGTTILITTSIARKDGYVVDGAFGLVSGAVNTGYGQLVILSDPSSSGVGVIAVIGKGALGLNRWIAVGQFESNDFGATWVFQGTVLEDATAGTHISSLTVTPGAGNEMQLLYFDILAGAGAANITGVFIRDAVGGNIIARLVNGLSLASGQFISGPSTGAAVANNVLNVVSPIKISGAMAFILQISTATVSLTHTFAVACRIKGALPTATLADSVGVPTLTTNTSSVF